MYSQHNQQLKIISQMDEKFHLLNKLPSNNREVHYFIWKWNENQTKFSVLVSIQKDVGRETHRWNTIGSQALYGDFDVFIIFGITT